MAEHKYHQATLQHLAHLRQDSVPRQGASVLQQQVAVSEAALEAHLQQRQQQAVLQQQMAALLTRSFPAVQVVVDAPLQMAREVQGLQRALGQPSAADLEPMLTSLARALPASAQLSSLQFTPGELRWQAQAVSADRIEAAREPLRRQGYQLVADGTQWVLRTEVRP